MSMNAADIMTRSVVSVEPGASVQQIAALLTKHGISAVPVIDPQGHLRGMVSEGDLVKPLSAEHQNRRDWWLEVLAEGERLAPEFLDYINHNRRTAGEIMTRPVITAPATASITELAGLLGKHNIKRVPIMEGETVIGIVSRANIVRALAQGAAL